MISYGEQYIVSLYQVTTYFDLITIWYHNNGAYMFHELTVYLHSHAIFELKEVLFCSNHPTSLQSGQQQRALQSTLRSVLLCDTITHLSMSEAFLRPLYDSKLAGDAASFSIALKLRNSLSPVLKSLPTLKLFRHSVKTNILKHYTC